MRFEGKTRSEIFEEARRIIAEPDPSRVPSPGRFTPARWHPQPISTSFYDTNEWLELRYRALKLHGGLCQCCGNPPVPGNPLQVDHIKPRSRFPELEMDLENLQVLCKSCNIGKGAWDQTDWRHR